jgi:hypothetical protein
MLRNKRYLENSMANKEKIVAGILQSNDSQAVTEVLLYSPKQLTRGAKSQLSYL